MKGLYSKALSVLKVNVVSAQGKIPCRWTTPDRFPHHGCMWLWDSAFHALGLRLFDPAMAENSIRAVLSCQRTDGFVSLYANPNGILAQEQTQPPILAWATWKAYEQSGNKNFLEEMYPALCRYVRWDKKNKDPDRDGLMEWGTEGSIRCKGGESGMDNSPRFDAGVQVNALDFNCFLAREAEELARIAKTLDKPAEAASWTKWRAKLVKRINEHLWCPHEKTYYDRVVGNGLLRIKTEVMFLPLFAGVADRSKAGYLRERLTDPRQFWTPMPLPSVAADENTFTDDMWRGPVWLNYNYLVIEGLLRYGFKREARELRATTLEHVHHWYRKTGCIWEFYDPMGCVPPPQLHRKGGIGKHGGASFGTVADYGWSASVSAALLAMEI